MNEEIIATRYARAIFDIAVEGRNVEETDRALDSIARSTMGDKEARRFWSSAAVERSRKKSVLDRVLESAGVKGSLAACLRLLAEKNRFHLLMQIAASFRTMAHEHLNIARAKLTTARPLAAEALEVVQTRLERKTGRKIEMEQEHDPAILGGIVVRIENTVFDGSVRGRLQRLEQELAG